MGDDRKRKYLTEVRERVNERIGGGYGYVTGPDMDDVRDAYDTGTEHAEEVADWLATMAEECARQADNPDDDSTLCDLEACRDLLAIVRRHKEQAEAERDAAMLYHARDWAMTERLVRLSEGACVADGLRELYPEHAERLLAKRSDSNG